jgi:hypothetical protein
MSATRRIRLVPLVFLFLLAVARPASAQWWWLTWLDELSGPGPYHGPILPIEIYCFGKKVTNLDEIKVMQQQQGGTSTFQVPPGACKADRSNTLLTLQLEMGFWDDDPDPDRYTGDTSLKSFELIAYLPVHSLFKTEINRFTRATDLGAGIGFYKLSGQTVRDPDYVRGAIPVRVRLLPSELFFGKDAKPNPKLRRALQALQVRAGWDFLPGTITSASFNGLPNGESSNEFVFTFGVQYDLGTLIWAAANKEK